MLAFSYRTKGPNLTTLAQAASRRVAQTAGKYLREEGEVIRTASLRIVPRDTGTLAQSAFVTSPLTQGTRISVTVGYGGLAAAYAVIQHENLWFHHTAGQTAKYLEIPAEKAMQTFPKRLAEKLAPLLTEAR